MIRSRSLLSISLLIAFTLFIFFMSEFIRHQLAEYELNSIFISFCTGFILFVPLVSLILHPMIFVSEENKKLRTVKTLLANIGLVFVVQFLFFIIWITDAIAVYSIYVDQTSFLAKAFNITSENRSDLSVEFYWFNLILAWVFALLSLVVGLMPCLIARIKNKGVVDNFVASFKFARRNKVIFLFSSFLIVLSVVFPLLYLNFLFIPLFPLILTLVIVKLGKYYLKQND